MNAVVDANYALTDVVSPALNLHFQRDAMGNIKALGNAPGANPATETYSYDPLYRLTGLNDANGNPEEAYTYSKTGDRLSKTAMGLDMGYEVRGQGQFITIGSIVHMAATMWVALKFEECEGRLTCVPGFYQGAMKVLVAPLKWISWIWLPYLHGSLRFAYLGLLLNSLVAVTLIWFVLVRPFLRRTNENDAEA